MEPIQLTISNIRDQARSTRSFDMRPTGDGPHGLSFIPGQVAVLKVADEAPAYFAFASAPEDSELEFLVQQKSLKCPAALREHRRFLGRHFLGRRRTS